VRGSDLPRRVVAEFVGTAFLLAAVIGSGIAASRLSPDDTGLQLFENAAATGAGLIAIILAFGPVSGAHLNPVITLVDWALGGVRRAEAFAYIGGQTAGAAVGVIIANLMFGLPAIQISHTHRTGGGRWLGEVVATLGLVLIVFGVVRAKRAGVAPFAVGAYIMSAYFFTSSTSFANPAVTLARTLSDTFAGIAPVSVPGFVVAELFGCAGGVFLVRFLFPGVDRDAADVVLPHPHDDREHSPAG
jgi:glycerol uptake facilitator-like aquaporin